MGRALPAVLLAILLGWPAAPAAAADPDEPINVGFLVLEGVYNSELMAPFDIFHHTRFHVKPGMRVFTVGRESGMVTSFEGLRIGIDHDLESAPRIDVLVVPSAEHNMDADLEDERLIGWVRERGRAARHVVSICDGAFVLAEAGLLDGRRCTTFPGDIDDLRSRYPDLTVVDGVRFVADGKAITGVGGARSYEPAMYLVERLYGRTVAGGVSRGMVLEWDLEQVRHLAMPASADRPRCYLPGDRIDAGLTLEDAAGRPVRLADAIAARPGTKAVVLTLIAGGEAAAVAGRGGLWCEDSFSEVAPLRHLRLDYAGRGVLFVGVLCPPVYHEERFGFDEGAFLRRRDDDPVFRRNRRAFVEASERLVEAGQLPFDVVLYDPRFRLLANPDRGEPDDALGPRPPWQGRFKWFEDTQTYGTPTTWIVRPDGTVPGPPFFMNVYESEGRKLRFTVKDMRSYLDRMLAD
jgi:putative intracellular protease/amidase